MSDKITELQDGLASERQQIFAITRLMRLAFDPDGSTGQLDASDRVALVELVVYLSDCADRMEGYADQFVDLVREEMCHETA